VSELINTATTSTTSDYSPWEPNLKNKMKSSPKHLKTGRPNLRQFKRRSKLVWSGPLRHAAKISRLSIRPRSKWRLKLLMKSKRDWLTRLGSKRMQRRLLSLKLNF